MLDMNQVDFAIRSYKGQLEDSEYERLLFFRDLWEIQAEAAQAHADDVRFAVPDANELKALSESGTPVLSAYPAKISADALVDTVSKIFERMSKFGQFDESARTALSRVAWDRMVTASDVSLSGKDPVAYVDTFEQLLCDDGLNEDSARIGASALALALRALLQKAADEIQEARRDGDADQPYPTNCPVCGSTAAVARVGGGGKTKGRSRTLWCAQCGCVWDIERVRCARCGTQNQGHLHFFNVEGDDNHRIATCDECGGYIRTVYEEDDPLKNLYPFNFEVEDVLMARLDLIAYRQLVAQEAQES
jgi:FdhE protein